MRFLDRFSDQFLTFLINCKILLSNGHKWSNILVCPLIYAFPWTHAVCPTQRQVDSSKQDWSPWINQWENFGCFSDFSSLVLKIKNVTAPNIHKVTRSTSNAFGCVYHSSVECVQSMALNFILDHPWTQGTNHCSGLCSRWTIPCHLLKHRQPHFFLAGKRRC